MKKIVIANFKMNQTPSETKDYMIDLVARMKGEKTKVVVCPPFTSLAKAYSLTKKTNVLLGAQNFHYEEKGAHTGEISAAMLKEVGVEYVIVGHIERRKEFKETNAIVNKKIKAALGNDLKVVFCVGETQNERNANRTEEILKTEIEQGLSGLYENELEGIIIAYEPIWAIGTGVVAQDKQISSAMSLIRKIVKELFSAKAAKDVVVVYGGSVNKQNAKKIMALSGVDGVLVGGASLVAEDFFEIIKS